MFYAYVSNEDNFYLFGSVNLVNPLFFRFFY